MGLSGAALVLVGGGGGGSCSVGLRLSGGCLSFLHHTRASLPQRLICASSSTSIRCLRNSEHTVSKTAQHHFVHSRRRSQRSRSASCMFTRGDGSQEPKQQQQQLSIVASDLSAAQPQATRVVEHVVLFKVKNDPKVEEVFEELRALKSLDVISELSASSILQILGGNYTHALHSRHPNKAALDAYAVHPSHQAVVKKLAPFVEDTLAVDWEALPVGLNIEGGHGAARIAFIKIVNGVTEEKSSQIFDLLLGLRNKFPFIRQISVGFNISPARAKGFNLGFVAMFENVKELQQLDGNAELHAELRKSRVSPFMERFVIVDIDSKHG